MPLSIANQMLLGEALQALAALPAGQSIDVCALWTRLHAGRVPRQGISPKLLRRVLEAAAAEGLVELVAARPPDGTLATVRLAPAHGEHGEVGA